MRRTETTTLLALGLLALLAAGAGAGAEARGPGDIRFLTGPQAGDPLDLAMAYVESHRGDLGLTAADLADLVVRDRYATKHNGVTHIHLQQRLDGVEVWGGVINVNVAGDGSIINLGNNFVSDLAARVETRSPALSDRAAIERAAEHLDLTVGDLTLLGSEVGAEQRARFSSAGLSRDEIPVRLVYQPLQDGRVRLAWETVLNLVHSPDCWVVRVDAVTGEVISKNNRTNYDSYLAIPYPPFDSPEESGGQAVVTDPADATASPFGWHDTDGVAGHEFTDTQGNNVDAHDDLDGDNGTVTQGVRPDGGATLDFLFPWDPALQPDGGTNLEAAIVNLFYANNVMHDLTYQYGFDEAAGNFQTNNYGNGGLGADQVEADAQDNAEGVPPSTNNANFFTPPDGQEPRMQMFVWLDGGPTINARLTVNGGPAAGDYQAAQGTWGGALMPPTTGDIEIVDDGSGLPTEGCGPLVGFTPGNIALIDRGTCEFGTKSLNAETAGASGVVIVNNQQLPNGVITMGAGVDGGSVTIPAIMIGNADGTTIRNEIPTVNATMQCPVGGCPIPNPINRDSDLDNGVIAHEYGHGISIRLTGGPANVSCLAGDEQAGEGWSDFWTLVLSAKPGHTQTVARGIGNYVSFLPPLGPGIRNFPYTVDLTVNPQTYADIGTTNVPHGVGEIWASMLWEVYWDLVARYGFDEDLYSGSGGNNLTIQLVIDGMKLQPCFPDFVEARDAILTADMVNNGGANQCEIWRGFAKRGLGVNADAGNPANPPAVGDETQDFTIPPECSPLTNYIFSDGFESGDTAAWSNAVP